MTSPSLASLIGAEWRRRWTVHPLSTLTSTVLFPALMVTMLFYLPTADVSGQRLELQEAVWSIQGAPVGQPPPTWAAGVLGALEDQPVYRLTQVADARGAFASGAASAAVVISRRGQGAHADVLRRQDLISGVLVDRLQGLALDARPPAFVSATEIDADAEASKGSLARVGLFVLLGFAWFFVSSGIIERLVSERERRSLEVLLSTPVDASRLVKGRLAEITLHASLAQVACGVALVALGFPPTSLTLPLLVSLSLYPIAFGCFAVLYATEDMLSASWKTGVGFMFAFPLLILISDLLGPLSPFFQLGSALSGEISWRLFAPLALGMVGLNLGAWLLTPTLARRWQL